jgi:hypothetical protein
MIIRKNFYTPNLGCYRFGVAMARWLLKYVRHVIYTHVIYTVIVVANMHGDCCKKIAF